jgi:hypothetical protein
MHGPRECPFLKGCQKCEEAYFCTFLLSHFQQYQWETLAQNMREFLSRYLESTPLRHLQRGHAPRGVSCAWDPLVIQGSLHGRGGGTEIKGIRGGIKRKPHTF